MKKLAIFVALLPLAACQQSGISDQEAKAVSQALNSYKAEVAKLRQELQDLQFAHAQLAAALPRDFVAFDSREPPSYERISSPVGTLGVRLMRVDPYLDGYTVTFQVGNPSTSTLHGVKGTIKWGEDATKFREKSFDLPNEFAPGAWTSLRLNVAPATAEQVRRINLAPTFDSVSLRRPID